MNWPLNINNFNYIDRIKIALFILSKKNRWTQDKEVKSFEKKMAKFIGCKYAVFVSSGSTANTLIAQYVKDKSKNFKEKNKVILPSTTWQTSCSPWVREGFDPIFIDVSMDDFSIDKNKLIKYVDQNHASIACIFPTSLIGYSQNLESLKQIQDKYKIPIYIDNCENNFGQFDNKNISSYFASSTSTYFGHQLQSIEGGFIFTNDIEEYEYFIINRNHGMSRSLDLYGLDKSKYINNNVDPLFDFYSFGNNFRNTDLNAFIGNLDLNRVDNYINKRIEKYNLFYSLLDKNKYYLPENNRLKCRDVPFCLPIIAKNNNLKLHKSAKELCCSSGVEYRPIISGFLGYQTCYIKYFKKLHDYPNSIYLHEYGFYVGLYPNLSLRYIKRLVNDLNNL